MKVLTTLLLLLGCIRGLVIESDARVVYPHTKARFGVDYGDTCRDSRINWYKAYVGRLVKVEPFHACSPITTNLTGLIGLAIRDTSIENCTFVVKVLNVAVLQKSNYIDSTCWRNWSSDYESETLEMGRRDVVDNEQCYGNIGRCRRSRNYWRAGYNSKCFYWVAIWSIHSASTSAVWGHCYY